LTGVAGALNCDRVFEQMKTFIANLNCTPGRAALLICATGWHPAVTKMALAMGS
jgi:hypothetical protein